MQTQAEPAATADHHWPVPAAHGLALARRATLAPACSPRPRAADRLKAPFRGATGRGGHYSLAMRRFNTEGPVRPDEHYAIQPLDRMDLDELLDLIRNKRYFALHAPRQTGKTSALIALRDLLNSGKVGDFRCVDVNVEVGQAARGDTVRGMRAILDSLAENADELGDDYPDGVWQDILAKAGPDNALKRLLARWCRANPTPLVLLVDEIDSLVGDTLLSVLRQLRAGYQRRPGGFPQSVVLCGLRDIRDYRVERRRGRRRRQPVQRRGEVGPPGRLHRGGDAGADGAAHGGDRPALLGEGAGGGVDADAGPAVAGERAVRGGVLRQRGGLRSDWTTSTRREELVLSRRTHLDQLSHKLEEARVRRVVEPILSGGEARHHARDLGLLAPDSPPRGEPDLCGGGPRELGYGCDSLVLHREDKPISICNGHRQPSFASPRRAAAR